MERINPTIKTTSADIVRAAFARAFRKAEGQDCRSEHGHEATALIRALDAAGFAIVKKAPAPGFGPDVDVLDLRSGMFVQDGKDDPLSEYEASAWLASMRALPVEPATRPTDEDVAIVVVMPDGKSVPLTSDEYQERSEHRVENVVPLAMQMKLVPGKPYSPMPIRPVPILAVFYEDGIISFAGDANDFVAFRDMAAKVVDPSLREA